MVKNKSLIICVIIVFLSFCTIAATLIINYSIHTTKSNYKIVRIVSPQQQLIHITRSSKICKTLMGEPIQCTLTTSVDPSNSGNISLDPPGGIYDYGTVVTLQAIPNEGYEFSYWSGDASGTNPTIQITMDSDKTVVAHFGVIQCTLTTSVDPSNSGNISLDPPGGIYDYGTVVTLQAIPNEGYEFSYWSGDASGTNPTIQITMDSDKTVVAHFGVIQCTLTTSVDPSNSGNISLDPPGGIYDYGTVVTLQAIPNEGYEFSYWSGDASGTNPTIQITMDSDKTVVAHFGVIQCTLTTSVDPSNSGNISLDPPGGIYDYGTVVTLQAIPNEGYEFSYWSGDASGTNPTIQITMDSDKTVVAHFGVIQCTLTTSVDPSNSGNISLDPPGGIYDYGTVVTLQAIPNEGYEFSYWSGDASGTNPTIQITMDSDKTVVAHFGVIQCTLTTSVDPSNSGNISLDPPGGIYDYGTVVTLQAIPNEGYEFSYWSGDASGTNPTIQITMDSDKTVVAHFGVIQCTLTTSVDPSNSGNISLDPPGGIYDYGTVVTLQAIPNEGYEFSYWSGDASGTNPTIQITMDSDKTVVAHFGVIQCTLTTSVDPSNSGNISLDPPGGIYDYGTVVTLQAIPNEGYEFSYWSGDASGTNPTIQITMDSDKTVVAHFGVIQCTLTTSVDPSNSGNISLDPPGGIYDYGTVVTLQAIPNEGYEFSYWSGDASGTNPTIQITMDSDKTVVAHFGVIQCTLTTSVDPSNSGNISLDPPGGIYDYGTVVTLQAIPNEGYEFSYWSGDASGTNPTIQITMDSDKTVVAHFGVIQCTLTTSVDPSNSGNISLDPPGGIYDYGTVVTLQAIPNEGYEFSYWSGDASGTNPTIQITMDSDKTVVAHFGVIQCTLTTSVDPSNSGNISLDPPGGIYDYGTVVTLQAIPNEGYEFSYWSGDASGTNPTIQITMDSDKSIIANFEVKNKEGGGNILGFELIILLVAALTVAWARKGKRKIT